MKTLIFSILALGVGFGGGYLTASKLTKKKIFKKTDAEIKSVRESLIKYYKEKIDELKGLRAENKAIEKPKKADTKPKKSQRLKPDVPLMDNDSIDQEKLKETAKNEAEAYRKYTKKYKPKEETEKEEKPEDIMKPYVISPDEFAESEYNVQTLNYYSDGVVADDDYNVVTDIEGYLGPDALSSFGIYDLDVVYVRNEKYEIDYEILLDERRYYDIVPKGATIYSVGDED